MLRQDHSRYRLLHPATAFFGSRKIPASHAMAPEPRKKSAFFSGTSAATVPSLPGDEDSPFYRFGRWVAENWETVSDFVTNPFNIIVSVLLVFTALFVLALFVKFFVKTVRSGWDALHGRPGEISLGVRRDEAVHYLTDPPVKIAFEDARKGGIVLVGPTGQGKTTALLLMLTQAFRQGHTVIVLESDGNLGLDLLERAKQMGLGERCFHFDPGSPASLRWNPLSGDPEQAVRRAVNTVLSVSQNHPFFEGLNENVARQMTRLTIAYAHHTGTEPTPSLLLRLLTDHAFLDRILDIAPDPAGTPRVHAPFVDGDLRVWLEQEYFSWSPRVRGEYLLGLRNILRSLLSDERVAELLSPEIGEKTIDLDRALDSGGLLLFRCASFEVGEAESQAILSWAQQAMQQATLGRKALMRPVWSVLDEAHTILGTHNTPVAQSYARWFVQARKFGVVPVLGYQSFFQLPDELRRVISGSARNKLVFGGLHGEDAQHAQESLGHTTKREKETRRMSTGGPFSPKRTQEVTSLVEGPYYSLSEVEDLPVGYCFYRGVRGKRQLPPAKVKLDRPR